MDMNSLPISALTPELPDLSTKHICAIVTLIWPFSSVTRTCAVLLADPDFRKRDSRGQVRVQFTGSSARAIAKSGIGSGDELLLALRGARFVERDEAVRTPGKSVEWELVFGQTVGAKVRLIPSDGWEGEDR